VMRNGYWRTAGSGDNVGVSPACPGNTSVNGLPVHHGLGKGETARVGWRFNGHNRCCVMNPCSADCIVTGRGTCRM
jgi:hypothetical protein